MTSERMTDEHIAVIKRLLPWLRERSVVLWNHDEVVAALDDLLREVERARTRETVLEAENLALREALPDPTLLREIASSSRVYSMCLDDWASDADAAEKAAEKAKGRP